MLKKNRRFGPGGRPLHIQVFKTIYTDRNLQCISDNTFDPTLNTSSGAEHPDNFSEDHFTDDLPTSGVPFSAGKSTRYFD